MTVTTSSTSPSGSISNLHYILQPHILQNLIKVFHFHDSYSPIQVIWGIKLLCMAYSFKPYLGSLTLYIMQLDKGQTWAFTSRSPARVIL